MRDPEHDEDIRRQEEHVFSKERELMVAKMRLRAMLNQPLIQPMDLLNVFDMLDTLQELKDEFGASNLRLK
jgi:hypothetical protein